VEFLQMRRVLIVANRTAATPTLLEHLTRLARDYSCAFTLYIPALRKGGYDDWTLERAVPLLGHATGSPVSALAGGYWAMREAVRDGRFDEIVISTRETRVSEWLGRDLPRRLQAFGLPVTALRPERGRWAAWGKPGTRQGLAA
jgi:hypothetical protein